MFSRCTTILSRSAHALLGHLDHLRAKTKTAAHEALLFSLSSNTPKTSLAPLVGSIARCAPTSVGGLSDALPGYPPDTIACSLAFFARDECVPFRSTLGVGQHGPAVGRRRPPHDGRDAHDMSGVVGSSKHIVDWEDIWAMRARGNALPTALQGLRPQDVKMVLYLSADTYKDLSDVLLREYPTASSLGLLVSPTPFVTGRPYTLFQNENVYSDGAVGLAFTSSLASKSSASITTKFPGLSLLTPPLKVTQSQGNLVISLASANPTQLLLSALRKEGIQGSSIKDDDFFLGVFDPSDDQLTQVYRITSGDPVRGTISLDSDYAPREGSRVGLYRLQQSRSAEDATAPLSNGIELLVSRTSDRPLLEDSTATALGPNEVHVLDAWVSASLDGWVLRDGHRAGAGGAEGEATLAPESALLGMPWKCSVGGGRVRVGHR